MGSPLQQPGQSRLVSHVQELLGCFFPPSIYTGNRQTQAQTDTYAPHSSLERAAYACPKWCADSEERSKLHPRTRGFFPTASLLALPAPLFAVRTASSPSHRLAPRLRGRAWAASPPPLGLEPAEGLMLRGGRRAPQGASIPAGQLQPHLVHICLMQRRPAGHGAEPFASNCTPKASASLLPITAATQTKHNLIGKKV